MSTPSKKRLALAIIDFLNTSIADGTISSDDRDSAEIAAQGIQDAFSVDPSDNAAMADALGGQNLLSIYSVYEKLKGKSTASTAGTSSASEARPATPQASAQSGGSKEEAEALKGQGNAAMQKKDYNAAIEFYTKALDMVPLNPIYLSNRAAAYSGAQRHEEAKGDAEMAVAADPSYTKAWSRLGLAKFALGDARGSMEAYKSGIDAEGNGGSEAMKKGYATAKAAVEKDGEVIADDDVLGADRGAPGGGGGGMPDLGALAGMLGGGGGGGGGMPDFGSIMQNPMMRQMAQNLMSNPDMMSNMLNNPRLREMAQNFGGGGGGDGAGGAEGQGRGGGGMPDIASLMQDPSIAEMARNFMGGAGGQGGAGRGNP